MKIKNKGITLIALVITIVIMMILVGVVIGISFNNGGMISKTEKARAMQEQERIYNEIVSALIFNEAGIDLCNSYTSIKLVLSNNSDYNFSMNPESENNIEDFFTVTVSGKYAIRQTYRITTKKIERIEEGTGEDSYFTFKKLDDIAAQYAQSEGSTEEEIKEAKANILKQAITIHDMGEGNFVTLINLDYNTFWTLLVEKSFIGQYGVNSRMDLVNAKNTMHSDSEKFSFYYNNATNETENIFTFEDSVEYVRIILSKNSVGYGAVVSVDGKDQNGNDYQDEKGNEIILNWDQFIQEYGDAKFYFDGSAEAIESYYANYYVDWPLGMNNTDTIVKNGKYTNSLLIRDNQYILPESVTVKINDQELQEGQDYTYDSSSGVIELIISLNGNLKISANPESRIAQINYFGEGYYLENSESSIVKGGNYSNKIVSYEGYELPNSITVTMGGILLLPGEEYTYNALTGNINIQNVTKDLTIEIITLLSVNYDLQNIDGSSLTNTTTRNSPFEVTFIANSNYKLPEKISVTDRHIGPLIQGSDYTWNSSTGELTIANVMGILDISIYAEFDGYNVNYNLEHINRDNLPLCARKNQPFDITFSIDGSYYIFPDSIIICMGDNELVQNEHYTWNSQTGRLVVQNVTGELTINITGVDNRANVTYDFLKMNANSTINKIEKGTTYTNTFTSDLGYTLPSILKITSNGQLLTEGTQYTWNSTTGELIIPNVTGDINISNCVNVTYSIRGAIATVPLPEKVAYGDCYAVGFRTYSSYKMPNTISVTMGNITMQQRTTTGATEANEYHWEIMEYNNNEAELRIYKVTGDLNIVIRCTV